LYCVGRKNNIILINQNNGKKKSTDVDMIFS
jgi:hypothetical protein